MQLSCPYHTVNLSLPFKIQLKISTPTSNENEHKLTVAPYRVSLDLVPVFISYGKINSQNKTPVLPKSPCCS